MYTSSLFVCGRLLVVSFFMFCCQFLKCDKAAYSFNVRTCFCNNYYITWLETNKIYESFMIRFFVQMMVCIKYITYAPNKFLIFFNGTLWFNWYKNARRQINYMLYWSVNNFRLKLILLTSLQKKKTTKYKTTTWHRYFIFNFYRFLERENVTTNKPN